MCKHSDDLKAAHIELDGTKTTWCAVCGDKEVTKIKNYRPPAVEKPALYSGAVRSNYDPNAEYCHYCGCKTRGKHGFFHEPVCDSCGG